MAAFSFHSNVTCVKCTNILKLSIIGQQDKSIKIASTVVIIAVTSVQLNIGCDINIHNNEPINFLNNTECVPYQNKNDERNGNIVYMAL